MKKDTVWNSCCILDSIRERVFVPTVGQGETVSGSRERNHASYDLFSFFFFCVLWDQGKRKKRWSMLMFNLRDTGSISSIKLRIWWIFMLFFFLFSSCFVIESSVFWSRIHLHWKQSSFYVVVFWNSFPSSLWLSFCLSNVDFVAQSLASGTVDVWEEQILSSLIVIALLEKKPTKKYKYSGILGLRLTIKKTT